MRVKINMKQVSAGITSNVEVMPGIYLMWLEAPDIALISHPGQFITVNCEGSTLRRPFSIHQTVIANRSSEQSKETANPAHVPRQIKGGANEGHHLSEMALLFKVVGKGTFWLSQRQRGDNIDILGPLGKGFTIAPSAKNLLLVAGGIGIAPLIFLAQHASPHHSVSLIHGVSTARELYPLTKVDSQQSSSHYPRLQTNDSQVATNLSEGIRFIPATEDGTAGEKGMLTEILPRFLDWADQVFACGPVDMYKAMANMSSRTEALNRSSEHSEETAKGQRNNLKLRKCQVSLEMRMGCGIGACYGCTINTKKGSKQVCRDGPVFELDDILWQEVRI